MADVPKNYLEQIKKLEQQFTVDTQKLKEITEHFVSELTKGIYCVLSLRCECYANFKSGLTVEGGSIVCSSDPK